MKYLKSKLWFLNLHSPLKSKFSIIMHSKSVQWVYKMTYNAYVYNNTLNAGTWWLAIQCLCWRMVQTLWSPWSSDCMPGVLCPVVLALFLSDTKSRVMFNVWDRKRHGGTHIMFLNNIFLVQILAEIHGTDLHIMVSSYSHIQTASLIQKFETISTIWC